MVEELYRNPRGREAHRPREIPPRGWWDVIRRMGKRVSEDHIMLVAAGVAFYAMLAIFPALAALVSIHGLFTDPAQVEAQVELISGWLPSEARAIIGAQLRRIASLSSNALGWGLVVSLMLALWSASAGVGALMEGLNIVYSEREQRSFLQTRGLAMLLTLGAIVAFIVAMALITAIPIVLDQVPFGGVFGSLLNLGRWVVLASLALFGLAVLDRYSPDRRPPRWRWVTPGSILAGVLWLGASAGFSLYVGAFESYDHTYGSLAAVVVMLIWLWISAPIRIASAELNAELEAQTRRDTTVGPDRPRGERGAVKADQLGAGYEEQNTPRSL